MSGKTSALLSALVLATLPAAAEACVLDGASQFANQDSLTSGAAQTGGASYGDRNRGGPYGFYSYPRHRSVDGGGTALASRPFSGLSAGTSPTGNAHGSAYYGPDYGAPYFGGGYYDEGVYYRERGDR